MKSKLVWLILLAVLILPTFSFFLGNKMFTFNDETQIANLFHYFKTIDLGQFPPRWAVDMHFEYGSPFPEFNYQLPYYLGYLGHLAKIPNVITFKLLLSLSVIIGAFGMFFAGEIITGSPLFSLFAAVLYTYTPYQSIDHFVRGTLGEVYALALFPWIYLVGFSLLKEAKTIKIWLLGLLLALLVLSHQPAALVALPFFGLIFILTGLIQRKFFEVIAFLKVFVIGLLLSAYYWVPVLFEKKFIQTGGPYNYLDQFPFLKQLIYSSWSYQGANPFSADTFSFQIGIVNLVILAISSLYLIISFIKNTKPTIELWLFRLTLIATFVAIFLMNIRSSFVWRSLPLLQQIQFPWRLLMFTTWFIPFLFLLIVSKFQTKWTKPLVLFLLIASIIINIGYFRPGLVVDRGDDYYARIFLPKEKLSPGESVSADYLNYAEDYAPLPKGAVRPKSLPPTKLSSVFKDTKIIVNSANPILFKARVENRVSETLTFNTFSYPGWKVIIDGYPAKVENNNIGAITFSLAPGKHDLVISYTDTPVRLFSNIISLSTIIIGGLYTVYYLTKKRVTPTA